MKDVTNLRKASGRRYVAFDPEMSEWGNLAAYAVALGVTPLSANLGK